MSSPSTGGSVTLTLPDATASTWWQPGSGSATGKIKEITLHRPADDTSGTLSVAGKSVNGTQQLINGATSTPLAPGQILRLRSHGTGWWGEKTTAAN